MKEVTDGLNEGLISSELALVCYGIKHKVTQISTRLFAPMTPVAVTQKPTPVQNKTNSKAVFLPHQALRPANQKKKRVSMGTWSPPPQKGKS